MSTTTLLVETSDLRRALKAVAPFVEKGSDVDTSYPHGRMYAVAGGTVTYLAATNGVAAALALVSTLALTIDGEVVTSPARFALGPADIVKILACFPGRDGKDGEPGDELRLDLDGEHLVVTDASGLFEGQSLVLGRLPDLEHAPDLLALFRHPAIADPVSAQPAGLATPGPSLALLVAASKVYGPTIRLEFHPRAAGDKVHTLARIGDSFLALISEAYTTEEEQADDRQVRAAWVERLFLYEPPQER